MIPLNIDWQQILLHLFNFVILATGLYLLLYKPVKGFMKQRTDYYVAQERQAIEVNNEAEKLKQEYGRRLQEAQQEINHMKAQEMKKITRETQHILERAKEDAARIISEADQEARLQKKKISENAQREIAKMVITAAEKLMLRECGRENDRALYDQFLISATEGSYAGGDEK